MLFLGGTEAFTPNMIKTNSDSVKLMLSYFLHYGGISVLLFLPVYFRHLQMNESQIGILRGMIFLVGFLGSSAVGALADKLGSHKCFLLLGMVIFASANCSIFSVDLFQRFGSSSNTDHPNVNPWDANCTLNAPVCPSASNNYTFKESGVKGRGDHSFKGKAFHAKMDYNNPIDDLYNKSKLPIELHLETPSDHRVEGEHCGVVLQCEEINMVDSDNRSKNASSFPGPFPYPALPGNEDGKNESKKISGGRDSKGQSFDTRKLKEASVNERRNAISLGGGPYERNNDDIVSEVLPKLTNNQTYDVRLTNCFIKTVYPRSPHSTSNTPHGNHVQLHTPVTCSLHKLNPRPARPLSNVIFPVLFVLSCLVGFWDGAVHSLLDNSTLSILDEDKIRFGFYRLWGALGFGLMGFLIGVAIQETPDFFSSPNNLVKSSSYFMALPLLIVFSAGAIISVALISFPSVERAKYMLQNLRVVLSRLDMILILTAVLVGGITAGVINSFLFIFLEDLNGTQTLMGLSNAAACTSEVVMFHFADRVIGRIGHFNAIKIGLAANVVRLGLYSFLGNPWFVLLLELLHGFTFSVMWSSVVTYCSEISSQTQLSATIQGILSGVFAGLGPMLGGTVGGVLYFTYGARILFRTCAVMCAAELVLLVAVQVRTAAEAVEYSKLQTDDDAP